jgi:hypothetical protein
MFTDIQNMHLQWSSSFLSALFFALWAAFGCSNTARTVAKLGPGNILACKNFFQVQNDKQEYLDSFIS